MVLIPTSIVAIMVPFYKSPLSQAAWSSSIFLLLVVQRSIAQVVTAETLFKQQHLQFMDLQSK